MGTWPYGDILRRILLGETRIKLSYATNFSFKLIKYSSHAAIHYIYFWTHLELPINGTNWYPEAEGPTTSVQPTTTTYPLARLVKSYNGCNDIHIFKCGPVDRFRCQILANFKQLGPLLGTPHRISFEESGEIYTTETNQESKKTEHGEHGDQM